MMWVRRGFWIGGLLLLASPGCTLTRPQSAVAKAAKYLWNRQAGDGGWHSHTYGLLRSGQSLTPFVLEALLQVPEEIYPLPRANADRAIAFITSRTQSDGSLGTMDPGIPDYPNYSTALAISALCRARHSGPVPRMIEYLRGQQFTEQNGWRPADPAYGAWGMGGERRTPPDTGHVDLSMTRYVLEALRASGVPTADPVFQRAQVFIKRCQNLDMRRPEDTDGGFFFSTTEFDTNKAGHDGRRFRSYGTTTADGILALLAVGRPAADPRVVAARRWLTARHHNMEVPGFTGEPYQRWPKGLAFYYAAASTQAFRALQIRTGVVDDLTRSQRSDGSWSNPENLVKEDDPLVATGFAVRALVAGGAKD